MKNTTVPESRHSSSLRMWRIGLRLLPAIVIAVATLQAALAVPSVEGAEDPLVDMKDLETFLETAEVIEREKIAVGITRPQKLTLTDGAITRHAVWKTIDVYLPRQALSDGSVIIGFRDSYRHEIAAYRLSRLLGLDLVPPTVERKIDRRRGSLQLWLNNAITEKMRKDQDLHAPDIENWNRQTATVRLFHQLIHDIDFNNINNLLITEDFRIRIIDSSRSFYTKQELRNEEVLTRFSRSLLDRLRDLDLDLLREELGARLSDVQLKAVLRRRDLILELAEHRVAQMGEEAVLFP